MSRHTPHLRAVRPALPTGRQALHQPPQQLIDLKAQYKTIKADVNKAIARVLERTDFILGEDVAAFEKEAARYLGVRHCVGVASGTDALIIALRACGVADGDEVITTPFTFIATAEAVHQSGGVPVFVDIDPATCALDHRLVAAAITPRTKAILPVHLYGQPAGMDALTRLAGERGIAIIEDCAQSMGAAYDGVKTGALGLAGAFSFFPGKNLGCYGDGGMISTNDDGVADRARVLRNHGCRQQYYHHVAGYNSRLDTLQAAVLRIKLKHLNRWNTARRAVARRYDTALRALGYATLAADPRATGSMNYYNFIAGARRDELQQFLAARGIATKVYYPVPLHLQEVFAHRGYRAGDFPHSERCAREILALPMYPELTDAQVDRIIAAIGQF